jgi:hypothetical protein
MEGPRHAAHHVSHGPSREHEIVDSTTEFTHSDTIEDYDQTVREVQKAVGELPPEAFNLPTALGRRSWPWSTLTSHLCASPPAASP